MIGLSYLAFFLLYFFTTALLTWFAVKAARRRSIAGWKWGVPTLLAMFLLVFWDWIPTVVAHKYYCAEEAGLTVYKTLHEWKEENPDFIETLTMNDRVDRQEINGKTTYILNERFSLVSTWESLPLSMAIKVQRIVDRKTGEIMAERRDVPAGIHPIGLGVRSIRDLKIWFSPYKTCVNKVEREKWLYEGVSFQKILGSYRELGRRINE